MLLASGLGLPESPRWRDGRLVFSDVWAQRLVAVDDDGNQALLADLPDRPSGLGWLPDGRLLVVLMRQRRLVAWADGIVDAVIDLAAASADLLNELIVHPAGHVYVGDFRFPDDDGPRTSGLLRVDVDTRTATRVATGLYAPNGMAITPDGGTLIVAETGARRLTAFTVRDDGSLADQRLWAPLDFAPDGICMTDGGAVWVASPQAPSACRLIAPGGAVMETLNSDDGQAAFACVLGGTDRQTLYRCEAPYPTTPDDRRGRVVASRSTSTGAGWP